eukprot:bmy_18791T0
MVGIPLFGDQHDNIACIKAKGAAVELNLHTITSSNLLNTLNTKMEKFVQSFGEDGVVLFLLESMMKNFTKENTNMITVIFAQIP